VQSVAFAVRLLPGQTEAVRIALASCWAGARKEAYRDARRRAGIVREAVWIQSAPGSVTVLACYVRHLAWSPGGVAHDGDALA
jgi:hypothetical protein